MTVFVSPSGLVMGAQNGVGESKPDRGLKSKLGPDTHADPCSLRSADFSGDDRVVMLGAAPDSSRSTKKFRCPALFLVARDDASGDGDTPNHFRRHRARSVPGRNGSRRTALCERFSDFSPQNELVLAEASDLGRGPRIEFDICPACVPEFAAGGKPRRGERA